MKTAISIAMLMAGLLVGGATSAQAAAVPPNESIRADAAVQLAQMNSPGDGLSSSTARTGNGRSRMHHGRRHHWHHRHHWHRHWRHHRPWHNRRR